MHPAHQNSNLVLAEWEIRLSPIVWFVLILGVILSLPVLFDWASWLLVGVALGAFILALPIAWIIRMFSIAVMSIHSLRFGFELVQLCYSSAGLC